MLQSTFPTLDPHWLNLFLKPIYDQMQWGKSYFSILHKLMVNRILGVFEPPIDRHNQPIPAEILTLLKLRTEQLLEQDWQDAIAGFYPVSLLFDHPWLDYAQCYPHLCADIPGVWRRANQNRYQDLPATIDRRDYPAYYLRNFHHQTDGYLSEQSAELYDLQVELLFAGTTDAMRRRIIPPLVRAGLGSSLASQSPRLLDVACGTGRTLYQLRTAFPNIHLYGLDLSPAYLNKAEESLAPTGKLPTLQQGNAELLPYPEAHFEAVTSVFLFHELPAPVRQKVLQECYRVLKPGGVLVICDSIQCQDSPEFKPFLENFPMMFHEPFYLNYIQDNMVERLEKCGFQNIQIEVCLFSKYWVAHRP
jgi:ubiquinone/menaquinone biosynthesis C-methylase UbiE